MIGQIPKAGDGPPQSSVDSSSIDIAFAKLAIEPRLQALANAQDSHIRAAQVEATKSGQIHALTRHGFQTGWAGQLLRICTKLTPDQEYDALGVNRLETRMDEHYAIKPGKEPRRMKPRTGGGVTAGHFYNPEIQDQLMKESLALATNWTRTFPECEVRLPEGKREWRPYDFIHVYLALPGGTGVAFTKVAGWSKVAVPDAVGAINDFMNGARVAPNGPLKYPTWQNLLDHLKVEQVLQNGSRAEINLKGVSPCMMTMMPETVGQGQTGFAPTSLKLEKDEKDRFRGCRWTGGLRNLKTGASTSRSVPGWTEPFK